LTLVRFYSDLAEVLKIRSRGVGQAGTCLHRLANASSPMSPCLCRLQRNGVTIHLITPSREEFSPQVSGLTRFCQRECGPGQALTSNGTVAVREHSAFLEASHRKTTGVARSQRRRTTSPTRRTLRILPLQTQCANLCARSFRGVNVSRLLVTPWRKCAECAREGSLGLWNISSSKPVNDLSQIHPPKSVMQHPRFVSRRVAGCMRNPVGDLRNFLSIASRAARREGNPPQKLQ